MGNKKKFDKLEINENYYKTHTDEEANVKEKHKKQNGLFGGIDPNSVPERQKLSNTFTFTKEKRRIRSVAEQRIDPEAPSKAPFIFMLVVVLLSVAAEFITLNDAFLSMSEQKRAIGRICLMIGVYIVPTVVYMISCASERRNRNVRPFSFSLISTTLICLGLVVSLEMLQKYFITYAFDYNPASHIMPESLLLAITAGALIPAVCEELFVGGVLQYEISKYTGGIGGVLVCGLVFAVIHFDLQYFTVYLVSGIIISALTHITHSVFPAMIVHFLGNTISILFSDKLFYIASRHVGGTLSMIILACLAFLFLIFLLRHAENISEKRAAEFSADAESVEQNSRKDKKMKFDRAGYFLSPDGRTASRLAKAFSSPFLLLTIVVFIAAVIVKQNM